MPIIDLYHSTTRRAEGKSILISLRIDNSGDKATSTTPMKIMIARQANLDGMKKAAKRLCGIES